MNKMQTEISYLRSSERTTRCELAFWLKVVHPKYGSINQEIKSVRQIGDNVASLLTHTENKIIKLFQDNCDIKVDGDELRKEMCISLSRNDQEFSAATTCEQLLEFKRKVRFKIFDTCYRIIINAPLIMELTLPNFIYANTYAKPLRLKGMHLSKQLSKYKWSKSKEKENWIEVFNDCHYMTKKEDIDYYLKLTCTPLSSNGTVGPIVEVISENVVDILPESQSVPMLYRQNYTEKKLTGESIRIVTYNTLAEKYTEEFQFDYCDPGYLSMDYRKQIIFNELMSYKADIICLQEIDLDHYHSYFKKHFKNNGYMSFYFKKGNIIPEGLSLAVDSNRFTKLDVTHIVLAQQIRKKAYENIWSLIKKRKEVKEMFLKQHTSLLVAVLKCVETNNILIVANTHLYYHCEAGHIRVLQIAVALKYIKQQCQNIKATESGKISVIFCGDFNSRPDTAVYHFLTEGNLTTCEEDLESIGGCTSNVFQHDFNFENISGTPEFTNYTEDFHGCLDYIFCQKGVETLQVLPFPSEEEVTKEVALPNQHFPSDHISVVVDVKF